MELHDENVVTAHRSAASSDALCSCDVVALDSAANTRKKAGLLTALV
jgi:hypothetical protein